MVKLSGTLGKINPSKILLAGDLMVDLYTQGKIERISPEAPVPIVCADNETLAAGGAGNVALNLISLGAKVTLLGRVGDDEFGEGLIKLFEEEGVNVENLIVQKSFKTPIKNRIIANGQQIIRMDYEKIEILPEDYEKIVEEKVESILDGIQIVAISDYGKGFLTKSILNKLVETANERDIPVIVDPKGDDLLKYGRANIIKPNLSEAYAVAKLPKTASLEEVAEKILQNSKMQSLLITRSENGMTLFPRDKESENFPANVRSVRDVTGAGDTVLAMICVALANKIDIREALQFANIAAGIAVERVGCARINIPDIAKRVLAMCNSNKVFDEGHLFALQQALIEEKCFVLSFDHKLKHVDIEFFNSLKKAKEEHQDERLLIYLEDNSEIAPLLASLSEVDFVIIGHKNIERLKNLLTLSNRDYVPLLMRALDNS